MPIPTKQIFSQQAAREVRTMLEMAAQPGGTAPKAQIPGYRVGGKTGTAYKIEGGQYVRKYVASFVGFAPVSDPRLVVAVMIDEPSAGGHYGGDVAGPIFPASWAAPCARWASRTMRRSRSRRAGQPEKHRPERENYDSANGFHAGRCWRNHAERIIRRFADLGVQLTGVADDSRKVRRGDLFMAYPGDLNDGRRFIADAIARGAAAVFWEARGDFVWNADWRVANLSGTGLRAPLAGRSRTPSSASRANASR